MSKRKDSKWAQRLIEQYKRRLEVVRQSGTFNPRESKAEQQARIDQAKADPRVFAETYLSHYCSSPSAEFQVRFAKRVSRDQVIKTVARWPRGHAKSVWCNVILPLWLWARGEPMYLVIVGASFDKAKVLLSDAQAEFEANPRLLHDFGDQKMQGSWEDGRFITKGGFIGQGLGIGQSVRGLRHRSQRPTLVVVDDCETKELVKNEKRQWEMVRWVEQDLLGTMDGPFRRLLIANNGFAPEMIQRKLLKKHPKWHLDEVKAYDKVTYEPVWPQKYTADYWRELESENGKLAVHAEYLHEPHVEGTIFTDDLFNVGRPPAMNHLVRIIAHWDVAYAGTSSADYNAVRVWGVDKERRFWLLATYCKQSKMADAVRWMVDYDRHLPETVVVHWQYESQFWNAELERTIQEVCTAEGHELRISQAELSKANKYDRILSLHPFYQNGRIWFSDKLTGQADHEVGLAQLKGIEPGYSGHDDAPDADERAISLLSREVRASQFAAPVFGQRQAPKRSW
ncbi:MAG: hypothetical protein JNL05_10520 [Flavobacteriales bacterium]|nr:hypothetical protein [Flavobacteriales bacterium]